MKTEDLTVLSWEDLVFENRNKAYGAYAIRKSYSKNVMEATLATISFGGLLVLYSHFSGLFVDHDLASPATLPKGVILDPPPLINLSEIRIKPAVVPPPKSATTNTIPVVSATEVTETDVLDRSHERYVETSDAQGEGVPVPGESVVAAEESPVVSLPPPILDNAERMPAYEGGLGAMSRFLHRLMKYPPIPRKLGIEGTVFVQFVINGEGKVVDVHVIKGIHADCDKEAARVIALMPMWKPGMQNHMPVSVRMVLPIKFQLEN